MALLQAIQKASLLTFLIASMGGLGMQLDPRALLGPLKATSFVVIALMLNFVLAPALAWGITALIPLRPGHATGLLLLGVAAGAPFLPKLAEIAQESVASATAVMVMLTVATVLLMPVMLTWLIPGFQVNPLDVARPMVLLLLLPLGAGMILRAGIPRLAAILGPVFVWIGSVSLMLLFVLLVGLNLSGLLGVIGTGAMAAALLHTAGLFLLSWLLLGTRPEGRGVQALCVSARNFGAAMVPAAGALGSPDVMIMLVACAVVGLAVCVLEAVWLRRRRASPPSASSGTASK